MKFRLQRVHYMPDKFEPGVLYASEEFDIALHLCACGCGTKISTILGPTEYEIRDTDAGPTLRPSVGNWQQACQSHYFVTKGEVVWAPKWTPEQIAAGRQREQQRRNEYYAELYGSKGSLISRLWAWVRKRILHR